MYRIFFHPLSKHPGPWLAKVSNFYAAYHAWTGDIHIDMWRCHKQYGKLVRYAPDRLLVNTAEAVRDIYGHKSNVAKSQCYDALVHRAPNILTLRDKKQHGIRRRVISQALSDSSIASFVGAIMEQIDKFVSIFANLPSSSTDAEKAGGWSVPINVAKWCDYLTFDIMTKVVFDAQYDVLGKSDHRPVLDAILDSNVRMGTLYQYPALEKWKSLNRRFFPAAIAARSIFVRFVTRMVTDRIELGKKQRDSPAIERKDDVFGRLSKTKDPDTGATLTLNELGAESTTLIVAGSDTTSTAIAGTLFYLARHPEARRRVQSEVRAAFTTADEITLGPKLSGCSFLSACIHETMRLSPPVGSSLWRRVLDGGINVDGTFVPAGCDVGVSIYSVQRCESLYPAPAEFVPDRWLVEGEEPRAAVFSAFGPFSRGPRSCVGKGIAMAELMLTMARVCWELEWRFGGGKEVCSSFVLSDHVTGRKDGPVLQFRRVE